MARPMGTQDLANGLSGAPYSAVAGRRRSAWGASVFLLAGALVILSVLFGNNDDSSAVSSASNAVTTAR